MEEAEVLCDRVAIMAEGRLRCIGNAADIKRRFGDGFKLTIHTATQSTDAAKRVADFVRTELCADATPLNTTMGGTTDFELPSKSIEISVIYQKMEERREHLGIADWALRETSLEEVRVVLNAGGGCEMSLTLS
jgi:ABC-type multidrug transport system ATPase subunit